MPAEEYTGLLKRLLAEAGALAEHRGTRVFLTGSWHDTPHVLRLLESSGFLVVGEDHDWGDLLFERPAGVPTLEALAERYQHNGPSAPRASIRARAAHTAWAVRRCHADLLLSYARAHDDAPAWDFAAQRDAAGVPAVLIDRQPYGEVDLSPLKEYR
jgi:hypothetical protein